MDMTIEIHIRDASRRAAEDIKSEIRRTLSGNGFRVSEVEPLSPEAAAQEALAATAASSARIRVFESE